MNLNQLKVKMRPTWTRELCEQTVGWVQLKQHIRASVNTHAAWVQQMRWVSSCIYLLKQFVMNSHKKVHPLSGVDSNSWCKTYQTEQWFRTLWVINLHQPGIQMNP